METKRQLRKKPDGSGELSDLRRPAGVRIGHNSFFLLASQVIAKLSGFAGVILLARILEIADSGTLSLALAVTGIVSLFIELGLDQLSIREIARDHGVIDRYFSNAALVKLVLSLFAVAATWSILRLTSIAADSGTIILILTIAMIPSSVYHLIIAVFMGTERMGFVALTNTLAEIIRLALIAFVLLSGYGLVAVAWTYVFSVTLVTIVAFIVLRLVTDRLLARASFSMVRAMVRESIPFMFLGLFFVIYFKIDFVMLAAFKDEETVGSYAAAYRLMESLLFVPAAFMGAVYPTLSRIYVRGKDSVLQASRKTLRYMAMIGIPIGFGTTVLAERIIVFLFGEGYLESVLPLQVIIWAMVLIFLNCICPVGLNSVNRQKLSVVVTAVGVVVNIALNLVLIPPFGAVGTSIATTATEMVTTGLFLYFFARHIGHLRLLPDTVRPLLAGAVMAAALIGLSFLPLAALIVAGAMTYFACLILLGALVRTDLEFFRSLARPGVSRQETAS